MYACMGNIMVKLIFLLVILFSLLHAANAVATSCFSCNHVPLPSDCGHVIDCGEHESCAVTQYVSDGGHLYYDLGCIAAPSCTSTRGLAGNLVQDDSIIVCQACCNGSYCNTLGCGAKPPPTIDHRGPVCFNCAQESHPDFCESVTACPIEHVCSLEKFVNSLNGQIRYKSQCKAMSVCSQVSGVDVLGRKRDLSCTGCCTSDFCNRDCSSVSLTIPTTHAVTMQSTAAASSRVIPTKTSTTQNVLSTIYTTIDPEIHREQMCNYFGYTYVRHLSYCVKFYTNVRATWRDARTKCQADGGDLATFRNLDEETLVQVWLKGHLKDQSLVQFFVGASDIDREGTWTWVDGTPVQQALFRPNEPNNNFGVPHEDCATLFSVGSEPILLNDDVCDSPFNFICGIQSYELAHTDNTTNSGHLCRNHDYQANTDLGICYKVYDNARETNQDARMFCNSHGSELLQLRDKHTEQFFQNLNYKDRTHDDNTYWLGAYRGSDGQFYWYNGHKVGNNTLVWDFGEPNNFNGIEDCLDFKYTNDVNQPDTIAMNDDDCNKHLFYICEEKCPNTSYSFYPSLDLCLRVIETDATWSEARDLCRQQHSDLLEPNTLDKIKFIDSFLKINNHAHQFWVGASRTINQEFEWQVGNGHVTSSLWHHGEPSEVTRGENCVSLERWSDDGLLRLNDANCNVNKSFICQYMW